MPLVFLVISMVVVRFSVGFPLYPLYKADAIWWSMIASGTSSAVLAVGYYFYGGWRKGTMVSAVARI